MPASPAWSMRGQAGLGLPQSVFSKCQAAGMKGLCLSLVAGKRGPEGSGWVVQPGFGTGLPASGFWVSVIHTRGETHPKAETHESGPTSLQEEVPGKEPQAPQWDSCPSADLGASRRVPQPFSPAASRSQPALGPPCGLCSWLPRPNTGVCCLLGKGPQHPSSSGGEGRGQVMPRDMAGPSGDTPRQLLVLTMSAGRHVLDSSADCA